MIKNLILAAFVFVSLSVFSPDAPAQDAKRIKIAPGTNTVTVKGTVRGHWKRDYLVKAAAGQMMRVRIKSTSGSPSVFAIFRPNGEDLGTAWQVDSADGELPVSGDYLVRVGLRRDHLNRRGAVSSYILSITIE